MSETKKLNIIITGCNSGIGLGTLNGVITKYADQVGTVIMACRNKNKVKVAVDSLNLGIWDADRCTILPEWLPNQNEDEKGAEGVEKIEEVDNPKDSEGVKKKDILNIVNNATNNARSIVDRLLFIPVELNNIQSVTLFSKTYLSLNLPLDILILNAGIGSTDLAYMFDINVVGHYHMTRILMQNMINAKAKIVVVSSETHGSLATKLKENETIREHFFNGSISNSVNFFSEYGLTKLCNIWFSNEIHKRYNHLGIRVNALHPGVVKTNFGSNGELPTLLKPLISFFKLLFFVSTDEGAKPSLNVAFSPELDQVSGKYFHLCKEITPYFTAFQENRWTELWDLCEQLVKEKLGDFQYDEIISS